VVQF